MPKNDPKSVLRGLKWPVLVLSGRDREISGFSFAADRHFYVSPFHFRLLPFRQNGVDRAPHHLIIRRQWHHRTLTPKRRRRRGRLLRPYNSVCLFVCLFAVNVKTTARVDAKRSGITKNDPESVLRGLKSPFLVLSERYHDNSGFSFAADGHSYLPSSSGSCLDSF